MKQCFLLILCLVFCLLISGCEDNDSSSSDEDGDTETIEAADQPDPCLGAAVDCSPGECVVVESSASCQCPEGYHAVRYSCQADEPEDGDSPEDGDDPSDGDDPTDGDTSDGDEIEIDIDSDPEEEDICDNLPTEGPFAGLPCCRNTHEVFPCISDLSFEETNEFGEFRLGDLDQNSSPAFGVWSNWVLFKITGSANPSGLYLFDFGSKIVVQINGYIGDNYPATTDGAIRNNHIIWQEIEEWTEKSTSLRDSLWTSPLDKIQRIKISDSPSAKFQQAIFDDKFYFRAIRRPEGEYGAYLYSFDEAGEEYKLASAGGVLDFTVYDDRMVLTNGDNQLHRYTISTGEKTLLEDYRWPIGPIRIWENTLFVNDLSNSPSPGSHCGVSIITWNLDTLEKKPLLVNEDYQDYWVDDVWQDWMVYSNCDEGGLIDPEFLCCNGGGMGDVWLRYLPTGEQWNLTNTFGDQGGARMWGPLVVWVDGHHRDNGNGKALYGIDLCKHPELKDRFEECAERKHQ